MTKRKKSSGNKKQIFFLASIMALLLIIIIFFLLPKVISDAEQNPVVVLETTKGKITLSLDRVAAPVTVNNFLRYVDEKYYDGLLVHKIIRGRFIEAGVYTPNIREKPTHEPIILESNNGLKNRAWTIAMGRQAQLNSATNGFFINLADNPNLDYNPPSTPGFAVFGNISSGFDVLSAINSTPTIVKYNFFDWPAEDIIIIKAYRKR
jgi:peptidyl-prolyl cis-trans isomerase A (cyclophilin A)